MTNNVVKAYTLAVLTLPITTQYKSFIPGISIGELFILLILPFIRLDLNNTKIIPNRIISNPFFWYVFYLIIGTLITITTQVNISYFEVITRLIRYLFYIFCAVVVSNGFFDLKYCIRWYRRIAIFATLYLMLQVFLFYSTGYLLRGTISWLSVTNELYNFEGQKSLLLDFYRPHSIFMEPGYYAIFTLPFLVYNLFKKPNSNIKMSIFLTIGLVLSTSGQALILSAVTWFVWIIKSVLNKGNKIKIKALLVIFLLVMITPFILQNENIQRSIDRLWGSPTASANSRVFEGFIDYNNLPLLYKTIGIGYGNDVSDFSSGYMNSLAYVLVHLGIIGFILILWIFIYMFIKTKGFQRILLLILFLLSGVGTIFISSKIILYISIVMCGQTVLHANMIKKKNQKKYSNIN
jgi:hypothetical protein